LIVGTPFSCGTAAIDAATGCVKYDPESTPYASNGAVTLFRTGNNAWLSTGIAYAGPNGAGYTAFTAPVDGASPSVAENPHYIVEDMGRVKPPGAGPQHESGATGPNN